MAEAAEAKIDALDALKPDEETDATIGATLEAANPSAEYIAAVAAARTALNALKLYIGSFRRKLDTCDNAVGVSMKKKQKADAGDGQVLCALLI